MNKEDNKIQQEKESTLSLEELKRITMFYLKEHHIMIKYDSKRTTSF